MGKNAVEFKGSSKGVRIVLDESTPITEILNLIKEKARESNGFFKGKFNVFVCGRELSRSDRLRISSVLFTVFPEAVVSYDELNII